MGSILSSTVSFTPYEVGEGIIPKNIDWIEDSVKEFSFRDIDDTFDEFSVGWVSPLNMFDSGFEFPTLAGDTVFLSMRVDQRKVAPKILKKFCAKEEERIKKERQIPKLSRAQRLEIKENMLLMLMKKAVPTPMTVDIAWSPLEGKAFVFSASTKSLEIMEELFYKTFGLRLVKQVAGNILDESQIVVTPAIFA